MSLNPSPPQDALLTEGEIAEAVAAANTKAALDRKSETLWKVILVVCLCFGQGQIAVGLLLHTYLLT